MKISKYLVLPLLLLTLGGCTSKDSKVQVTEQISSKAPSSTSAVAKDSMLPYIKGSGKTILSYIITSPSGEQIPLAPSADQRLTILSLWSPTAFNGADVQLQELSKLQKEYAQSGLRIIVIAYDTPSQEITEIIKKTGVTLEIGTGTASLFDALNLVAIPTTWYVDSTGTLIKTVEGFEDLNSLKNNLKYICDKYGQDNISISDNITASSTSEPKVSEVLPSTATSPTSSSLDISSPSATSSPSPENSWSEDTTTSAETSANKTKTSETSSPTASPSVSNNSVDSDGNTVITLTGKVKS